MTQQKRPSQVRCSFLRHFFYIVLFVRVETILLFSRLLTLLIELFTEPDDIYSLMALRVAHKAALDEKRSRVIIIIKGDIGNIDHFQPELRAYLKTNICLRWEDNDFFNKLCLAIAHPKCFEI